jgi:hypothetical protein
MESWTPHNIDKRREPREQWQNDYANNNSALDLDRALHIASSEGPTISLKEDTECQYFSAFLSAAAIVAQPCRHDDGCRLDNARAAASSFLFGAGGFSSSFRTRKLSREENRTWSASLMTLLSSTAILGMTATPAE